MLCREKQFTTRLTSTYVNADSRLFRTFFRETTLAIYIMTLIGMAAYTFTFKLSYIAVTFVTAGATGCVDTVGILILLDTSNTIYFNTIYIVLFPETM